MSVKFPIGNYILYAIIFAACLNPVLRPASEIPITPYYLMSPIIGLYLAVNYKWTWKWIIIFILGAVYGFAAGIAYGTPFENQVFQSFKYLQLLVFFLTLMLLYRSDKHCSERLVRIIYTLTLLIFIFAIFQEYTGFQFESVVNDESHIWLNTIFFTPNDLGLYLSGVFCIALNIPSRKRFFLAFVLCFFVLNFRNDAKAAILAAMLMILMYGMIKICTAINLRPIYAIISVIALLTLSVLLIGDKTLEVGETEINIEQLFADPYKHIVTLEPYNLAGSIYDRTDAMINGLSELINTGGIGFGPGGSTYMLSLPEFELLSAKSMHNAILEFIFDFGLFAYSLIAFCAFRFIKFMFSSRLANQQIVQACFISAAPLLSVSQSSGFVSNYAFWLTVFVIFFPSAVFDVQQI